MSKDNRDLLVGLDIGTSKVVALVAELAPDGQFNVVWKTPGPVKAKPWSPYIEGNASKPDEPVKK